MVAEGPADGTGVPWPPLRAIRTTPRIPLHLPGEGNARLESGTSAWRTLKARVGTDGIDEVWAFFDRDQWSDIPQVFAAARRAGVRVAFSHPAFELWLMLHFRQFAAPQGGDNTR